jgi:hypothetical protein
MDMTEIVANLTPEFRELLRKYLQLKAVLANPVTRAMYEACDDRTMAGIINDNRRSYTVPRSMAVTPDAPPPEPMNRPSVVEPRSLKVPGVALCDNMMDEQDRRDRQEQIARAIDHAMRSKIK